MKLKKWSTDS